MTPGFEPSSADFQSAAMTTLAQSSKAKNLSWGRFSYNEVTRTFTVATLVYSQNPKMQGKSGKNIKKNGVPNFSGTPLYFRE